MILIKNKQRKYPIDTKKIEAMASAMLAILGYEDFDLGILFTTDKDIQKYNRDFRNQDKPTDILSFPYHPTLKAGTRIKVEHEEDKNLGDLIIAPAYIKKDAETRWNSTLEERLPILLAHGIAHLLGHDHITDQEYKKMATLERKLLKTIQSENTRYK